MISIIVPTFNEKDNIAPLISGLTSALSGAGQGYEIIVVDDNSPDGTGAMVSRISSEDKRVRLLSRKGKMGLTSAVCDGAKSSKGSILVVMDADLSHPPELAPALADALSGSGIAVGSRLMKGGGVENWPIHRKLISAGADFLAHVVLGVRCTDPLSGFFAVRRDIFMKTRFRTKGYKLLLNLLADNPGIRVRELPYCFRDRYAGKTKLGYGEIFQYLLDLFRIRFG